jgi:uncharacterized protein YndB with AHSA1/START domain
MTSDTQAGVRVLGILGAADGNGVVRIEDRYDTNVEDLWSALTDPTRLARWYGEVEGDLHLGGEYHAKLHATGWEGTGRVTACDPPRTFTTVAKDPDEPNEETTTVTLTADGDQTLLVFEQRGMPLENVAGYGAGNQIHIEDLADHIAGLERRTDVKERFQTLIAAYRDQADKLNPDKADD